MLILVLMNIHKHKILNESIKKIKFFKITKVIVSLLAKRFALVYYG